MRIVAIVSIVLTSTAVVFAESSSDFTIFQEAEGFQPEVDFGSDIAVVYGTHSFAERAKVWREHGYGVSMMTGIAWGEYADYYGVGETLKRDEIQTDAAGKLFMHGNSESVGYNVPTDAYVEYIKRYLEPAIEAEVQGIYLEEPEFWADTGWSKAFQREWELHFNEPWQAPNSSVDAQYRASRLKYELYFEALRDVIAHVKQRAKEKGIEIECHVPTHSLISYAHWRIVSPESHLVDISGMDGYIAQVWTGTARTPNVYRGERKERTFETAYFEYGQAYSMVQPTGRKLWFLQDPVEDNPNRSWEDYQRNYEATLVAALLWPEVYRYEVMPWPHRIFNGNYPQVDLDTSGGNREGIPADYATELLTLISTLNNMKQPDVRYETGTRGVGVVVSDSMMFQRAAPLRSDRDLGAFYGLALPLLKQGISAEVIQLENTPNPETLRAFDIAILTYEGQKPLKPEYHDALVNWVKAGHALLFCESGEDSYHGVREWWNGQGSNSRKAYDDLFEKLGLPFARTLAPVSVGDGFVSVITEDPSALQKTAEGADAVTSAVEGLLAALGREYKTQNYLRLDRGPYVVVSVLEESVNDAPLNLKGAFVDLMDPDLAVFTERSLAPGRRGLYYNLDYSSRNTPGVIAAAGRLRDEQLTAEGLSFVLRGPAKTTAAVRLRLSGAPARISLSPEKPLAQAWDAPSSTLLINFEHAGDTRVEVAF